MIGKKHLTPFAPKTVQLDPPKFCDEFNRSKRDSMACFSEAERLLPIKSQGNSEPCYKGILRQFSTPQLLFSFHRPLSGLIGTR